MKRNQVILIVLLIIALAALTFSLWRIFRNPKTQNLIPVATTTTATNTESVSVEEKKITNNTDFYEINIKYPEDSRDKNKEIESFILASTERKKDDWKVGGEIYNDEKALTKLYPDRANTAYTYDITYQTYEAPSRGTISYVFNTYEFTGGAHGNSVVNTFTFNKDGKIAIDDILTLAENNNDIKLSRVLAEKIRQSQGDMVIEDMLMEGLGLAYLKADGKTLDKEKCNCDGFFFGSNFQNFYLTDEGITFLFNQYQVAPGAAGIVKVTLDWDSLNSYLKK
ncbi:hypothetical protein SDC9_21677 [bioreactor metagenome]|uniref:DUF3298 domain-containing protein n=1 Tax=bioreactor metagenome TaxID=1076179 RepID=A0A644UAJ4_9ZZZZ|nr:DUF3298 and DUF4163 domain-containing protein [Candidatus Elulimicrobiales bacterium]